MISVLENIWHGIASLPFLIIAVLVESMNGWIAALGAIVHIAVLGLPSFPAVPDLEIEAIGVVNWFFPVGAFLVVFSGLLLLWVAFLAIKVALNWGKVNV